MVVTDLGDYISEIELLEKGFRKSEGTMYLVTDGKLEIVCREVSRGIYLFERIKNVKKTEVEMY